MQPSYQRRTMQPLTLFVESAFIAQGRHACACRPHHSFPPAPESTDVRRWTQKVRRALQRAPCNRQSRPCEKNLLPQKSRKGDYPLLISNPRCGRWSTRATQAAVLSQRTLKIQTQRTSGSKWIFRYGEPETAPLPSRLWLFGMYVAM
jgi:hypothetical protein